MSPQISKLHFNYNSVLTGEENHTSSCTPVLILPLFAFTALCLWGETYSSTWNSVMIIVHVRTSMDGGKGKLYELQEGGVRIVKWPNNNLLGFWVPKFTHNSPLELCMMFPGRPNFSQFATLWALYGWWTHAPFTYGVQVGTSASYSNPICYVPRARGNRPFLRLCWSRVPPSPMSPAGGPYYKQLGQTRKSARAS